MSNTVTQLPNYLSFCIQSENEYIELHKHLVSEQDLSYIYSQFTELNPMTTIERVTDYLFVDYEGEIPRLPIEIERRY